MKSDHGDEHYGRYDEGNQLIFVYFLQDRGVIAQYTMPGTWE